MKKIKEQYLKHFHYLLNAKAKFPDSREIDVVMPMYNLIKYSDNYSKTFGGLWQYYRVDPNANLEDSNWFESK